MSTRFVPVTDIFPGDICYVKANLKDWDDLNHEVFIMVEIESVKEKCVEVTVVAGEKICVFAAKNRIYRHQTDPNRFRTTDAPAATVATGGQ